MSLQNLGKVKSILDVAEKIPNRFMQMAFMRNNFAGMDLTTIVKSLKSLGKSDEDILDFADILDLDAGDVLSTLREINKEGVSLGDTFKGLGTTLSNTFKGIGTGLVSFFTNPAAIATTVAVIAAASLAIASYNNSFSKLKENADEARSSLAETTSEISNLQSEINSNKEKISELSSSDASKTANESEIASLERQNALLQTKLDLLQEQESIQRQEAATAANKVLNKEIVSRAYGGGAIYEGVDIIDKTRNDMEELIKLKDEYDSISDEESDSYIKDAEKRAEKQESILSDIKDLESEINNNKLDILSSYDALIDPTTGKALEGFESTVARIEELFPEINKGSLGLSENMQSISDAYKNAVGGDTGLVKEFNTWLSGLSSTDQDIIYEISLKYDTAAWSLQDWQSKLADCKVQLEGLSDVPIDIEVETTSINSLKTALGETASATGLTAESIKNLKDRYKELDGFDATALFENTATGVRLNTREVTRLEKRYENLNRQKINESLEDLSRQYKDLTKRIAECQSETAKEDYVAQRNAILDRIDYINQLAAEYNGLTSAYAEWINAQNTTQAGSWYDEAKNGLDSLNKLYESGDYGNTSLQEGLEFFTRTNITGIDDWRKRIEAIDAAYNQLGTNIAGTSYSINDFMAGGQQGCEAFLQATKQLNGEWAKFDNTTQSWELDYNTFDLAAAMGTTPEFIEMMQNKLEQFGFQFNNSQAMQSAQTLEGKILEVQNAVEAFNSGSLTLPTDLDTPEKQLQTIQGLINQINNDPTTPEVDASQLQSLYELANQLIDIVDQPMFMNVDVSQVDESLRNGLTLLQEYQRSVNNTKKLEISGASASDIAASVKETSSILSEIASLDSITLSNLGFNLDGINADSLTSEIEAQIPEIQIPIAATMGDSEGSSDAAVDPIDVTVTYHKVSDEVDSYNPPDLSRTVTYTLETVGSAPGNVTRGSGAARASGTINPNGNIGSAPGGKTLMGELGKEIYVDPRTNMWYTVGDNGAEFVNLPSNAIVFNHRQTESLLNRGHITGRGKALASGNAAAYVLYDFIGGSPKKVVASGGSLKNTKSPPRNGGGSNNNNNNNASSNKVDTKLDDVDWIEIAIDRVKRAVERFSNIASSAFKSIKTRLNATADEITTINREIALQQSAYDKYISAAESVNLSSDLKSLVRNGTIEISQYDEETRKKISEYQDLYEKALDCSEAIDDLHESLANLYKDKFDSIEQNFSNQLEQIAYSANSVTSKLDALEAKGYLNSVTLYKSLMDTEKTKIEKLNQEYRDLNSALNDAMASGEIEKYSDAWYEMSNQILDIKEELDKANISLIEYKNTMREIEWGYFDYAQERIAQFTKEADFLVELMSDTDLYNDNGQMSDTGLATVGIYGMNYNTYMKQADQYATEIKKINAEIAKDPNNTKLIERREELLELQRDSITAAKQEKQSIVDMVKNGIDVQLNSMQELIDKYNDALDSAKDLNDYQKKLRDQASEISNLNKQLAAYTNDNSEETRATIQKLQVELQKAQENLDDTEYQQYITDQKKLLSDIYDEYQATLNQRLDNIDSLIEDMIGSINFNSDAINATLHEIAEKNGYMLSDDMSTVWSNSAYTLNGTISAYGNDFNEKLTGIGYVLNAIQANTSAMVANSNSDKYLSNDIPAFATGGLAKFTGLAHLDGTPTRPELVLNAEDTANFIALKDILRNMSDQELTYGSTIPYSASQVPYSISTVDIAPMLSKIIGQTGAGNNQQAAPGDINFNIEIEHVQDYNDFVTQLQHDNQFEKMIQAMTIDRAVGGNPLNKYKYQFGNR